MSRCLTIATTQLAVHPSIQDSLRAHITLAHQAKEKGADIVHFSENSLTGYPGVDFESYEAFHTNEVMDALATLQKEAASLQLWIIVGGHHESNDGAKPTNCLWVINDEGTLVCRYDKRICAGNPGELEHLYFTPGTEVVQFHCNQVRCGLLICHEWRYPELYREQQRLGTEVLFHSFYDRTLSIEEYQNEGCNQGSLVQGTVRGNAANNYLWISASNTSQPESSFASFLVRPDGTMQAQAERNVESLSVNTIDLDEAYRDPSRPWRERVQSGILHSHSTAQEEAP